MFAYCENNPISNCDPSGNIPSDISSNAMLYGGGGRSTYLSKEERKLFAAIKKYNKYTINFCVGEIGNDPNRLNVTFYPDAGLIHIENSYLISDKYEKLAVISAIMSSEYYDKTLYGDSVDTMLIEWSGHNFVYRASTNSKLMYRFFQWRGYDNPIQSTQGVDFRKTLAPSAKRNYEFVTLWGWIQW